MLKKEETKFGRCTDFLFCKNNTQRNFNIERYKNKLEELRQPSAILQPELGLNFDIKLK